MSPKSCPVCGGAMSPQYTYKTEGKSIVQVIYAWICDVCSYFEKA